MQLEESFSVVIPVQSTPLVITTPSLPNGQVGVAYNVTFQAAGGTPPYTWSLASAVPNTGNWMAMSGAGVLSGTPGTAENENVTVRVQDSSPVALQTQAGYGFNVAGSPSLTITTASPLPTATVGSPYSQSMAASGGTTPYTWSITSDTPDTGSWLSISSGGLLTGTPGTAETETVVIKVVDSSGTQQTNSKTFTLPVQAQQGGTLQITTTSPLPHGTVGAAYSTTMSATGGSPPYTWAITSDTPDTGSWLSIVPSTGTLQGTPGTAETETVGIKVTDSINNTATGSFSLQVQASSGQLTITTASLANGIVGTNYSQALAATGGTAPYQWTLVSATPNTDLWLSVSGSNLVGIPELTDNMQVIVQVTDSVGNTAQSQFSFVCTASGALSIVTPSGQPSYYSAVATQNGLFALRMLASGGQPPYWWALSGPAYTVAGSVTGTNYVMDAFGWLMGASSVASGTDTLTVICTDNNGATVTKSVTVTSSSTLAPYPKDSVTNTLNLPNAFANTAYQYQLHASGGSGTGYTYSVVSGLPGGMTVSSAGLITGAPNTAGSGFITLQVKDSASNVTSFGCNLNILSKNQAARPGYNTGNGFFVDANGFFRDVNGYQFNGRGLNRTHYDSTSWANGASGAIAFPGTVRVFMFDGQTAAFAANQITTQYQPNNIFTWLVCSGVTATNSWGTWSGQGTSGQSSTALLTQVLADWVSYESTLAPVFPYMGVNIANEWGAANSINWLNAYQYQSGNVTAASGNTITINTVGGANPFLNSPMCYLGGAGGITSQVLLITGTGGVSGAWTVNVTLQGGGTLSGYTGGGTLYGGAVGVIRGAGYTCPILIDAGGSGTDPFNILNYAAQIQASDPQKNCIFAHHSYPTPVPFQAQIASITKGNPTVITLNSNLPWFPLNPGTIPGGSSNNTFIDQYQISGALGVTTLNGEQPSDGKGYGAQGAWQLHLTVDSTAWAGTYTANSATIISDGASQRTKDYRAMYAEFAALRSSGVCVAIMEFGPGNQSGNPTTPESSLNSQQCSIGQIISSAEANGLPYSYWAWDDHSANLGFNPIFFNVVQGNNGVFTNNLSFTAAGMFVVGNPRYGLWARSQPAPYFVGIPFDHYISPTGNDANAGTLAAPWTIASLSPWSTGAALTNYNTKIAGKRIGLLPGTHGVSALMNAAWAAFGNATNGIAIDVPGGTSGNPTYIGSSNASGFYSPRTATIAANDNGLFGGSNSTAPSMIGQSSKSATRGWVTFDGLILSGASVFCMTLGDIAGVNTAIANGYVVQNCTFTGNSAQNCTSVASGKNVALISVMSARGAVITNNWFHDNFGYTDAEHFSAIYHWGLGAGTSGTQITFNTFKNSAGIQLKENTQYDMNVAYNYIDMSVVTPGGQLGNLCPIWGGCEDGNNGAGNPGNNGTLAQFHHNIVISFTGTASISPGNLGSTFISLWFGNDQQYWSYPVQCYNNTMVATSSLNGCGFLAASGPSASPTVSFFNNGYFTGAFNAVGQYGWFFTQENAFAVCDYNIYGTVPSAGNWANFSANGSTTLGAISATASSFANWKTMIGGLDAHSSTNATNPFTNNGTYALQYQVQSGSPWFQTGKVGGVIAGATCNVGAWDGTTTQIGCTFAT